MLCAHRYVPTQQERDNPLLFARNVRAVMAKVMKVPVTDHSYHDYLSLFDLARAAKIPQTFTLYECRSKYGLSASEVRPHAVYCPAVVLWAAAPVC